MMEPDYDKLNSSCLSFLKTFYKTKVVPTESIIIPSLKPYLIPLDSELRLYSANYFCPKFFRMLSLKSVYQIFCSILLEQSVIFQSKDLNYLTSTM